MMGEIIPENARCGLLYVKSGMGKPYLSNGYIWREKATFDDKLDTAGSAE